MKWWSSLVVAVLVAALAGFAGAAEQAQQKKKGGTKPPREKALTGVVESVNGSSIQVRRMGQGAAADQITTVTVGENPTITVNGKDGALTDLVKGMKVTITPASGKASKIIARTPPPAKSGDKAPKTPKQKKGGGGA